MKETDVAAMATVLEHAGIDTSGLTETEIEEAYESNYAQKKAEYLKAVVEVVVAELQTVEILSGAEVGALMSLTEENLMTEVLLAAMKAQRIKTDEAGNSIQATDEDGNPLYLDAEGNPTNEAVNADGEDNTPVYEMETIMDDESELFPAYWKTLSNDEKLAMLERVWEATVGNYPLREDIDHTEKPRDLLLNIGTSTGESYLLNFGDITVVQSNGTFTAAEVVTTHGNVSITAPAIEGVAVTDKQTITDPYVLAMYRKKFVGEKSDGTDTVYGTDANVYAGEHEYKATTGGIGANRELLTEQRSWAEDIIADILGESPLPTEYNDTNTGSWDILRNADGEIEMNFTVEFTGIRDIDL